MPFAFDDATRDAVIGSVGEARLVVGDGDTATAAGSGDLPVLATPRLIALMEQAACAALRPWLPDAVTSVGTSIDIRHSAPSAVGAQVCARATVLGIEGGHVEFEVSAVDQSAGADITLGHGTHVRAVVDRARFLERLAAGAQIPVVDRG